jgi:signal transduction histidine kinase/CheY-like chemotaxis protein
MGHPPVEKSNFLLAGGATGALMAKLHASTSPLGPPADWSPSLRTTVGLMLRAEAQIVLFWGPDFVALYNDAYAPTIGKKHPRALGRPARENWAELWDDLGPLLEGVQSTGKTFLAKDRPFYLERSGYGETVYFDVSYSAVPEADGSVAGVLCVVSETTERVRAETALRESEARLRELNETLEQRILDRSNALEQAHAALRQAQKMEAVGQLTGGIAHDFNNLLQGISGSLDLIRRRPDDAAKVSRWSEAGLKAAERGAKLASQLLAFSRTQKLELKPLDVTSTVVGFGEMLRRSIAPIVRIHMDLKTDGAFVMGDQVQLELAVLNLALNARDAMPDGGDLIVGSRCLRVAGDPAITDGDYVELSVADNGSGMPPAVLDRAFDPFFTTKETGKGTGLGLSQVYGTVTQSKGTVKIESAVGVGTTVRLYLPCTEPVILNPTMEAAAELVSTPAAKILIIDDDPDVRGFLAESLETLGYEAVVKDDGAVALAELPSIRPDVMIVDFAMPGMNGAEVARRARAFFPDLPIIFASGYSETAVIRDVLNDKALLLHKPFRVDDLQSALQSLLAKS